MPALRFIDRLAISFAIFLMATTTRASSNEDEPVLEATSFVQPALLSGPGFRVDPHVEIRGYMARFTLDTPVGMLQADSVEILADRVAELPALEALDKVTRSDAFISAAGTSISKTASGIGQVLGHPIDTLIGIPVGVARYFGGQLRKIGRQAQSASDRAARHLGNDGNPYPRDDGPMTETRSIDREEASSDTAKKKKRWYDRAGAEVERELKRQIKYSQVKRDLAEKLGIDPYTSNPYIRERLDNLAWVGSSGNYAASAALGAIGGVGGVVLTQGTQLNDIVWKLDPEQIREKNSIRLHSYCRDELLIRQFLRRGVFTPTLQTAMLDALDSLQPSQGGDALLELAMTASSELEARFVVNALRLIANELGVRAHGGILRTIGAGLAYDSNDGERVLPLPVDYLVWTDEVSTFMDRDEFRQARKTVLIGDQATMRSQRELTARGWNIRLRALRGSTGVDVAV
jgi:hypothetical protein